MLPFDDAIMNIQIFIEGEIMRIQNYTYANDLI